jgi:hypothetical protein
MAAPKLNGVLETALYVESLELSVAFYQKIFEFATLFSDARLCALNVSNQQILLLFLKRASTVATVASGGVIPPHDGDGDLHLAFSINGERVRAVEELAAGKQPCHRKRSEMDARRHQHLFSRPGQTLVRISYARLMDDILIVSAIVPRQISGVVMHLLTAREVSAVIESKQ